MKYREWAKLIKEKQLKMFHLIDEHRREMIALIKSMEQDSDLSANERIRTKNNLHDFIEMGRGLEKAKGMVRHIEEDMKREEK